MSDIYFVDGNMEKCPREDADFVWLINYAELEKTISDKDTKIAELEERCKSLGWADLVKRSGLLKEKNTKIAELEKWVEERFNFYCEINTPNDIEIGCLTILDELKHLLSNHPKTVDKSTDIVDKKWWDCDDIVDKE